MDILATDYETFWDRRSGYYLQSKNKGLPAHEYVNDPRFEIIGLAVKVNSDPVQCFSGSFKDTRDWYAQFEPDKNAQVSHHIEFDGWVTKRLGFSPKMYFCTETMARPFYKPILKSLSLDSLLTHMGAPFTKGHDTVWAEGKRREDFTPDEIRRYIWEYCANDTSACRWIFDQLRPKLPAVELRTMDMFLRMYFDPMFRLDAETFRRSLREVVDRKAANLTELEVQGITKESLRSNPQFAELLRSYGIEPPVKQSLASLKKGDVPVKMTYAFSKSDPEFIALREEFENDSLISSILDTRIAEKSTIEETRNRLLLEAAERDGTFYVRVNAYGAHTGRPAGYGKMNVLNLPKPTRFELASDGKTLKKVTSRMRFGVVAPPGHSIMEADKAQIECRLVLELAGQKDAVQKFRSGECVYSDCASGLFMCEVSRELAAANSEVKKKRDVGKAIILGSGFGMSGPKFARTVRKDGLIIDPGQANDYIAYYRERYSRVPRLWRSYEDAMRRLLTHKEPTTIGPVTFEWLDYDTRLAGIRLPTGLHLIYPNFKAVKNDTGRWELQCFRARDKFPHRLWGGIITENVVQTLAGIMIRDDMVNLLKELNWRTGLQVYDSVAGIVKQGEEEAFAAKVVPIMSRSPTWLPNLPVGVDVGWGPSYGDVK